MVNSNLGMNSVELRVYYSDTDAGGVVYHANYLKFLEQGRTEFLREKGLSVGDMAARGYIFPVIRVELDFCKPAVLDELLRVESQILSIGKTSIVFAQQVVRINDGINLVKGKVVLVCVNSQMKARRLPAEMIELLSS